MTLLFLSACASTNANNIKIGAVLSLTGPAAFYGENSRNGIELAVGEINSAGGINGKQVIVIYEDDSTDGTKAVTAAKKLIEIDHVDAIVGGTWDFSLEPMVPVTDAAKLIILNPSTGNTKTDSRLSPYLFRTWPAIASQVGALAPVVKKENIKRAVVFRDSGSWSDAHKENFEKILNSNGGELIADFMGPEFDNNDFATQITKAKSLNPDAVFFAVGIVDAANIVKKMKEQDFDALIISAEGGFGETLKTKTVAMDDFKKAYLIDLYPYEAEFASKYEKKYGKMAGLSADSAYTAMKILAQAYKETGTTDTEKVRDWLGTSSFFDANGDTSQEVPVYVIENGQRTLIK